MSMTRKAILDDVTVDLNRIVCFIRSQIKNNKNWGKKKERSASPGLPWAAENIENEIKNKKESTERTKKKQKKQDKKRTK